MNFSVSDIAKIMGAVSHGKSGYSHIGSIVFDTRKLWVIEAQMANPITGSKHISLAPLFVALIGRRNGHDFIGSAYEGGVRVFLVSHYDIQWQIQYPDAQFLAVDDVLLALQEWAKWHRSLMSSLVIGIAGSNGKTIVKEWLGELLAKDFTVYKSPRSFNSQLGVALSVLEIETAVEVSIIEAGISSQNGMKTLQKMVQANLVVLTHLGDAHSSGFESMEQKAIEKVSLAQGADVLVYPFDNKVLRSAVDALKKKQPLMKTIHWGWQEGATMRVLHIQVLNGNQEIIFVNRGTEHCLVIPFLDSASVSNAMSCLCVLTALERWDSSHIQQFLQLPRLENRLLMAKGKRGNYILNDSYSADLESLGVALDMLKRQSPNLPLVAILGDFEQMELHHSFVCSGIKQLLQSYGVSKLLAVGKLFACEKTQFADMVVTFFPDMPSLLASSSLSELSEKAILVKGARKLGLERVVSQLQERFHQTQLEINLGALKNNYLYFQTLLPEGVKTMCMVKAFGYGSGSFESARALQALGLHYLGVAYVDEGIALRKAGIVLPIMVMSSNASDICVLQEYGLEPVMYSKESLEGFIQSGINSIGIHLEIDTGMHRLGFSPETLLGSVRMLPKGIRVASVFSHLSASEDAASDSFTRNQLDVFSKVALEVEQLLGYSTLKHIQNTGAILRFYDPRFNAVRLGIGLYGIDPRGNVQENLQRNRKGDFQDHPKDSSQNHPQPNSLNVNQEVLQLQPVARWLTTIIQIQKVAAGEGVGYGMKDSVTHDRDIATIAVGYADGLSRRDGNGQSGVWINKKERPFVGNICMDMSMIDVTGLLCHPGDEVEIFGLHIPVETLAKRRGTIPYEVLTDVSQRVVRVYVEE